MPRAGRGHLLAPGGGAVLFAAACWSLTGLFVRWVVAGSHFSSLSLAFWRDLATAACLFAGLALLRPAWLRIERQDLPWVAALGAVGVGAFHTLWNYSILHLGYAVATVLVYASPVFVTLGARLAYGEPLTRLKGLAIAMALAGCVLVVGPEEVAAAEWTVSGLALGLTTALAYSGFSLVGRKVAARYPSWTVLAWGFGFGALALLPFQFGAPWPWPMASASWVWFAGLVWVGSIVPFGLYLMALQRLPVSVASIIASSEVAFGAGVGYAVFGERLGLWQVLGAALVVGGVALISLRDGRR